MFYFVAFGDSINCKYTRFRLANEAINMGVFDNINIYDESDLDQDFINKHNGILKHNIRGFGYWIWKPYIILQTLKKMNTGDYLLYCDIGCCLNNQGLDRLFQYKEMTNDILCFELDEITRVWSKIDVINHIFTDVDINSKQILATSLLIKKSDIVVNIINEWLNLCTIDNYRLVSDSPSMFSENHVTFKEHRHDQSIFDLLIKKYKKYGIIKPVIIDSHEIYDNNFEYPIKTRGLKY